MDDVQVELGPSKSKLVAEAVDRFSDWLTAQGTGTATFRFEGSDESACKDLLHAVSRLRKIQVTEDGTLFTRNEFLGELWRREREAKEAAWQAEYEAAGSCWPVPDEEFLSLACAAANGGDWDFDEERPMSPGARQSYLDTFVGDGVLDADLMAGITARIEELEARGEHPTERDVAYSLDRSAYQLENEYRWIAEARRGERDLNRAAAMERAVFLLPGHGCDTCRRLYLEEDGETPRVFLPHELLPVGRNAGLPLAEWLPTRPPLHLHSFTSVLVAVPGLAPGDGRPTDAPLMVTRLPSWRREPLGEPWIGLHYETDRSSGIREVPVPSSASPFAKGGGHTDHLPVREDSATVGSEPKFPGGIRAARGTLVALFLVIALLLACGVVLLSES